MPGRLMTPQAVAAAGSQEAGAIMGVYRLTIPETVQECLNPNARNGSSSFKSQRQEFLREYWNSAQPSPKLRRFLEAPLVTPSKTSLEASDRDQEHLDDGSNSSVFTTSSTRTSHTVSDDDSLLLECAIASRANSLDDAFSAAPKRHSTACCADMAFRREQRKRLIHEEPSTLDARRDTSLAMTLSFRRDLDMEDDRVDRSLALWEDNECDPKPRRNVHPAPHSWHAGDTAASYSSGRNKKKKKKSSTSSFFNGLFSGLSLSNSRRSRKSAS